MRKRIFIAVCLFIVLLVGSPLRVAAEQLKQFQAQSEICISPLWTHLHLFIVSLDIVNGRATMTGSVLAEVDTTHITVDGVLERVNANGTTVQVGSWNNLNATGFVWSWETTQNVTRGANYRLTLTAAAYRRGTSETATASRTSWSN